MVKEVPFVYSFLLAENKNDIVIIIGIFIDFLSTFVVKCFTYKPISIKIVWCILCEIVFRDERSDFGLTFLRG